MAKQIVIDAYTIEELKAQHPNGYKAALAEYQKHVAEYGTPWRGEIMASLKGLLEAVPNLNILKQSIDPYCPSFLRIEFDEFDEYKSTEEGVYDPTYYRHETARAWLEENLYSKLRITDPQREKEYGELYAVGRIEPCPFTGYCFDDDLIDALNKGIEEGRNLRNAFEALAQTARHLLEAEEDYAQSAEAFEGDAIANERYFDSDGDDITSKVE